VFAVRATTTTIGTCRRRSRESTCRARPRTRHDRRGADTPGSARTHRAHITRVLRSHAKPDAAGTPETSISGGARPLTSGHARGWIVPPARRHRRDPRRRGRGVGRTRPPVSRGSGRYVPVRINCPPEVAILTLKPRGLA
jgi:hypothetical protein